MKKNKAKLIYSMITSLDGYTEDERGKFGWGAPDDEEVHAYINKLASTLGTYLYGRKMYDTMVFWETAEKDPTLPKVAMDWAQQWKAAEKIVFSRTLTEPRSARTRIEHDFNPVLVQQLKANAHLDMSVDGPELATHAIKAGLVDEFQMIVCPVIVGGGKRFFPNDVKVDLTLIEEKTFTSGVMVVRYAVKNKQ
jgi:dihydrofolate reductase